MNWTRNRQVQEVHRFRGFMGFVQGVQGFRGLEGSEGSQGNSAFRVHVFSGMKRIAAATVLMLGLPLAACSVSVDQDQYNSRADVQIRTPVGHVFVKTGEQLPDTGLAIYPGSVPVRQHREAETANVSVGNSLFGVKVAAANFASDASPHAIVEYYRQAMRAHGQVTECREHRLPSQPCGVPQQALLAFPHHAAGRWHRSAASARVGEAARKRIGVFGRVRAGDGRELI